MNTYCSDQTPVSHYLIIISEPVLLSVDITLGVMKQKSDGNPSSWLSNTPYVKGGEGQTVSIYMQQETEVPFSPQKGNLKKVFASSE